MTGPETAFLARFFTLTDFWTLMKKYFVFVVLAVLFTSAPLFSQTYNTAAGVRMGEGFDLTFQQYIKNNWTAEGILHTSIFSKKVGVSVLAEKHHKVLLRNFGVYYGLGAHYYARKNQNRIEPAERTNNVYGLSGSAGAEVSLGRLNFALDLKPEVHFGGDQTYPFEWNPFSVSVRYIIDKRERKKMRDWKVWDKFKRG